LRGVSIFAPSANRTFAHSPRDSFSADLDSGPGILVPDDGSKTVISESMNVAAQRTKALRLTKPRDLITLSAITLLRGRKIRLADIKPALRVERFSVVTGRPL